jgi:cytochrome c peroxidase
MKSLKLRVRKTMFVFIAATGVFVLLFAQWRTHSQALMSAGAENLTTPLLGLTTAQLADFDAGLAEFQAVETIAEGLGPVFNGKSCAECHAVPSVGGSEPNLGVARETRIGRLFNVVFDPLDGSVSVKARHQPPWLSPEGGGGACRSHLRLAAQLPTVVWRGAD